MAPITKTLVIDLAEIEGIRLGGAFGQWYGTVSVEYDRPVSRKSGGRVLGNMKRTKSLATDDNSPVTFTVDANDDPDLTDESQGFTILVSLSLTGRPGPTGYGRGPKTLKTLRVAVSSTSGDSSGTVLLSKQPVVGATMLPQGVNGADVISDVVTAKTVAQQASAKAAASDAKAQQALDTAKISVAPTDTQIATLAGQSGSSTKTALDGAYLRRDVQDSSTGALIGSASATRTALQQRYGPAFVLATDYGVVATPGQTGTVDQSTNLQAAFNAAAASGATLLIPTGYIYLTKSITWRAFSHIVQCSQGTVLDWSAAAFTGGAVVVDGMPYLSNFRNNQIFGAKKWSGGTLMGPYAGNTSGANKWLNVSSTTTDGFWFKGNLVSAYSIHDLILENVGIRGFRYGEYFANDAFLVHHEFCKISQTASAGVYAATGGNAGENISYSKCMFWANGIAVKADATTTATLDMSFHACSFDYGLQALVASGGFFTFTSCHFEQTYGSGQPWMTLQRVRATNSFQQQSPTVSIVGGSIVYTDTYGEAPVGSHEAVFIATNSNSGTGNLGPTITVNVSDVAYTQGIQSNAILFTLHKETNFTTDRTGLPNVSIRNPNFHDTEVLTRGRGSNILNQCVYPGFGGGVTSTAAAPGKTASRWSVPATGSVYSQDTSFVKTGYASAKLTCNNTTLVGAIAQAFNVSQGVWNVSFWWAANVSAGDGYAFRAYFYYGDGSLAFNMPVGHYPYSGANNTNNGWRVGGLTFSIPPGITAMVLSFDVTNCTGTVWISDVCVNKV